MRRVSASRATATEQAGQADRADADEAVGTGDVATVNRHGTREVLRQPRRGRGGCGATESGPRLQRGEHGGETEPPTATPAFQQPAADSVMKRAVSPTKPIHGPPGVNGLTPVPKIRPRPAQAGKPTQIGDTVARLDLSPTDAVLAEIPVDDETRIAADEMVDAAWLDWWWWEISRQY